MSEIEEAKAGCAADVRSGGAIFHVEKAMEIVRALRVLGYSREQVEQVMKDLDIEDPAHG